MAIEPPDKSSEQDPFGTVIYPGSESPPASAEPEKKPRPRLLLLKIGVCAVIVLALAFYLTLKTAKQQFQTSAAPPITQQIAAAVTSAVPPALTEQHKETEAIERKRAEEEIERRSRDATEQFLRDRGIDPAANKDTKQTALDPASSAREEALVNSGTIQAVNRFAPAGGAPGSSKTTSSELDTEIERVKTEIRARSGQSAESQALEQSMKALESAARNSALGAPSRVRQEQEFVRRVAESGLPDPVAMRKLEPSCIISAGTPIPISILQELNTDIPGKFRAVVVENIHTMNLSKVGIPMGSVVLGEINPEVRVGQTRINALATRITTPQGYALNMGGETTYDRNGMAGISGDVNRHYFERFFSAAVVGWLGSRSSNNQVVITQNPAGGTSTQGSPLTVAASEIVRMELERNREIPPTITTKAAQTQYLVTSRDIDVCH
jgi:type IV secretory pathway VirB10-like protein